MVGVGEEARTTSIEVVGPFRSTGPLAGNSPLKDNSPLLKKDIKFWYPKQYRVFWMNVKISWMDGKLSESCILFLMLGLFTIEIPLLVF